MSDGFRFVHATNLRLDQPLTGAGALTAEERALVEDATLSSFSRLVDACINKKVQCLLLTGDCFEFQTGTLRGRLQMQRGLEKLAKASIPAIIQCGSLDPPASWKRGMALPPNTTLFTSDQDDPVELMEGDRCLVSIAPVAMAISDADSLKNGTPVWETDPGALRIGLVGAGTPVRWDGSTPMPANDSPAAKAATTLVRTAIEQGANYIALGEGAQRQTVRLPGGMAHDPGSPQGLNASESGAKGCSLVTINNRGDVDVDFIPTASVRWMSLTAEVPNAVDPGQLAERMALVVMESEPHDTDDLWLVRWSLRGVTPEWSAALADNRVQSEMWARLERELTSIGGPRRRHTLEQVARPVPQRLVEREAGQRDLFADFCEHLEDDALEALEAFREEMNSPEWSGNHWARHIRQALSRTTVGDVTRRATDLGESWLA